MSEPLLKELRFHHIGLACQNLKSEQSSLEMMGFQVESPMFEDPRQKIKGVFMVHGPLRIELLEPTTEDSPVTGILKRGVKMYHQCFECPDLTHSITQLESAGARLVVPPTPAVAFQERPIAFLMLKTMLLIELLQMEKP